MGLDATPMFFLRMKKRSEVKAEGWSNATLLPQLFEGGVFDDGFVEAHGGDWFTWRRGDAEVGRCRLKLWEG